MFVCLRWRNWRREARGRKACPRRAAGESRPEAGPAPLRPPRPSAQSDAAIEAAIRAKFAKSKINADKFQVHVQGGVATIEGRTNVIQHKGVATRLAKTGGAIAVNNHIQISDAAWQKPPPIWNREGGGCKSSAETIARRPAPARPGSTEVGRASWPA